MIFLILGGLLVPLLMVAAGWWMEKKGPKKINSWIGYRTGLSMKNEETWRFAQNHCGRTWQSWGMKLLGISAFVLLVLVALYPRLERGKELLAVLVAVLTLVQAFVMITAIFPTEKALEKTFDRFGNRR